MSDPQPRPRQGNELPEGDSTAPAAADPSRPSGTASASAPAPVPAGRRTPEEIERHWLDHVYQGKQRQLTFRAVAMGFFLGAIMACSNLYVGLKIGWSLGVAITACILSFSIFRAGRVLRIFRSEPTLLETNCMQSTAAGVGSSTGTTLVAAFSAYLMIYDHLPPISYVIGLVFFLAMLGVFMAIPMKRNMINIEQLPFPSGTAAAETLRSLYAEGGEALAKAKGLFFAMGFGALLAWCKDGMQGLNARFDRLAKAAHRTAHHVPALPSYIQLKMQSGPSLRARLSRVFDVSGYGFVLELSTILVAAGAIMGFRTGASMLLGAIVCYGVLAPWLHAHGVIQGLGYTHIVAWAVWPGVACMTTAALLNFALQGKAFLRAFSGMASVFRRKKVASEHADRLAAIEVPGSWFLAGFVVAGVAAVILNKEAFGIGAWLGALAILLSFVLAVVACRVTGETDTTPIGALGKITQLTYGVLIPQNMSANLMTANVTSSVAASSADLLTDLKSGYLLGANPRQQFLAQFFGVFAGAAVSVPLFYYLVRDPARAQACRGTWWQCLSHSPSAHMLGTAKLPAPSAQVWKAVAELLSKGLHSLDRTALIAIVGGGAVGILLTLLERLLPRHRKLIPSPTGIGLAFVIPCWNAISFFIGGLIALVYERKNKEGADRWIIPVASGLIAGESLMAVALAILNVAGVFG